MCDLDRFCKIWSHILKNITHLTGHWVFLVDNKEVKQVKQTCWAGQGIGASKLIIYNSEQLYMITTNALVVFTLQNTISHL